MTRLTSAPENAPAVLKKFAASLLGLFQQNWSSADIRDFRGRSALPPDANTGRAFVRVRFLQIQGFLHRHTSAPPEAGLEPRIHDS